MTHDSADDDDSLLAPIKPRRPACKSAFNSGVRLPHLARYLCIYLSWNLGGRGMKTRGNMGDLLWT